ncbi:hypothetical protein PR048_020103 [Dryococelus australis]|uniref:Uncharacterized protein n=1 Tax=Dryococelus australis TaxID=614101 RepID=A0ABQ9H5C0_9NEOP|nr:hypothetical protein PR048_020103 [Dryococelus australis]
MFVSGMLYALKIHKKLSGCMTVLKKHTTTCNEGTKQHIFTEIGLQHTLAAVKLMELWAYTEPRPSLAKRRKQCYSDICSDSSESCTSDVGNTPVGALPAVSTKDGLNLHSYLEKSPSEILMRVAGGKGGMNQMETKTTVMEHISMMSIYEGVAAVVAARALVSHQDKLGSIPSGVTPRFMHLGIVLSNICGAEDAFCAEILKEEFHVAQHRRKVLELHRELCACELELVEDTSDMNTCQNMRQRQASLSRALDLMKLKLTIGVVPLRQTLVMASILQLRLEQVVEEAGSAVACW